MTLPNEPVTLTAEQIRELNERLSTMRHDVNNHLSLISASAELLRRRPENTARFLESMLEQPRKISEVVAQFSADLESAFHITRP